MAIYLYSRVKGKVFAKQKLGGPVRGMFLKWKLGRENRSNKNFADFLELFLNILLSVQYAADCSAEEHFTGFKSARLDVNILLRYEVKLLFLNPVDFN